MKDLALYTSLLTDLGRVRTTNQDTLHTCEPDDPAVLERFGRLFIVADGAGGVGGKLAGKIASRYSATKVTELYYHASETETGERLRNAMLAANDAIRNHVARPGRAKRMATTMVAAVVRGAQVIIANVGDSRAYLVRQGTIQQITQDHSLVAGLVADGVITPEEAAVHPQRNVILHSLGSAPMEPRIDLFAHRMQAGDILLLCSDGLTRYADEKQLLETLQAGPLEQSAQRLIDLANRAGGGDNITAAVLWFATAKSDRWRWWLLLFLGVVLMGLSGILGLLLLWGV